MRPRGTAHLELEGKDKDKVVSQVQDGTSCQSRLGFTLGPWGSLLSIIN